MIQYVGTKFIEAEPMNELDYNKLRGLPISKDETKFEDGYLVKYEDGYISWSPKKTFEQAYKKSGNLDIGAAIKLAKAGNKVARSGWNGSGMFVYYVPAASYPATTEIAKSHFGNSPVPYREYLALKTAQGDVATWSPSGSDALAEDWGIVK